VTIVHLLWIEILDQLDLAQSLDDALGYHSKAPAIGLKPVATTPSGGRAAMPQR
jgi:hypothetical protein